MNRIRRNRTLLLALTGLLSLHATANINLPAVLSDHMVLQRNSEVPIWGYAKAREEVTIQPGWTGESYSVVTDTQGRWCLSIPTPDAGGPYNIKISGYDTVLLEDILIGEVWLASGQSNMEWSARSGIDNADEEVNAADYPEIRLFSVGHATATTPQIQCFGEWVSCTPDSMIDFSAAAYFFGRKLHQDLQVPVGLINSSWGGTPAESWTPEPEIRNHPELDKVARQMKEVPWGPVEPARLWNAMLAPIAPFQIRGAIWYQGEANVGHAETYPDLMAAMVSGWRKAWGHDFPFYFAQIAPWTYGDPGAGAALRDAQRRALYRIPDSGMIMTSDICGDVTNIHPRNKQDVGKRFAVMAGKYVYQTYAGETSGPLYSHIEKRKRTLRIFFTHADGLQAPGNAPTGFEIAGKDGQFHPADATVEGVSVLLRSNAVPDPVAARYAWENTAIPDLVNEAGLPASTFTTAN